MNRALRGLLACALGAGLLAGPAAAPASASGCVKTQEMDETLYLDLHTPRQRYHVGDVVHMTARVSRTRFDGGLPYVPVRDAEVYVYINVGNHYLFGSGVTDVRGAVSMPIRIKRTFSPGSADVLGTTHISTADGHCVVVEEKGDITLPGFLRVLG